MRYNEIQERISVYWRGLNRRERYLVTAAAVVMVIFLVAHLVGLPLVGKKDLLNRQLAEKQEVYQKVVARAQEYQAVVRQNRGNRSGLQNRPPTFTLFSFLDQLAGEAGVKPHITYMRPSTTDAASGEYRLSQVEMKLDAVDLERLASFLFRIEMSGNAVFVKRLSISRRDAEAGGVDAVLQVETVTG